MKGKLTVVTGFILSIILPILPSHPVLAESYSGTTGIIINEVKLGGDSYSQGINQPKDPQEFITIYNKSSDAVDLTGWILEYAKSTFDKNFCSETNWISHAVSGSVSQTVLSGTLQPGQVSTPILRSLTDNSSGSLHLVNPISASVPAVQDTIGWGASAPCYENTPANTPSNGKSIKRYIGCDNFPIDTGNNLEDFIHNQPPTPGILSSPYLTTCPAEDSDANTHTQQTTCEGVVLSEILPNPTGTDAPNEFIELHNTNTTTTPLRGCSLQTTGSSKVFSFNDISLRAGEYRVFYSGDTGLSLPNSAGGTVWLLSPNTELDVVTYQAEMSDDLSWSSINDNWHPTYQPTPNAANFLMELKPCPEGEDRNAETGYCRSIATLTTSSLTVCKEGQERNPSTNRCRSIAEASTKSVTASSKSTLTPCKVGQERNPATNRCRAITSAASTSLKSCPAGQERNPSTNRCRKASSSKAASTIASVKDNATNSIAYSPHWWLAGFAAFGATGYGVYEWRQEALQFLNRIKSKLPGIFSK